MTISLQCPACGLPLDALESRIKRLENENEKLQSELQFWNAGPFVGSRNRSLFHRPSCKWMEFVHNGSLLEFSSHEEAVAGGYKPCRTCCS